MKRKIITILFIISLLGNVAFAIHSQNLANKLSNAYNDLTEWSKYYKSMPKSFTYLEESAYTHPSLSR